MPATAKEAIPEEGELLGETDPDVPKIPADVSAQQAANREMLPQGWEKKLKSLVKLKFLVKRRMDNYMEGEPPIRSVPFQEGATKITDRSKGYTPSHASAHLGSFQPAALPPWGRPPWLQLGLIFVKL